MVGKANIYTVQSISDQRMMNPITRNPKVNPLVRIQCLHFTFDGAVAQSIERAILDQEIVVRTLPTGWVGVSIM